MCGRIDRRAYVVWHKLPDDLAVCAESFYRDDWGSLDKSELNCLANETRQRRVVRKLAMPQFRQPLRRGFCVRILMGLRVITASMSRAAANKLTISGCTPSRDATTKSPNMLNSSIRYNPMPAFAWYVRLAT